MFNTCAVRENADNKLYGNLGHLAPVKAKRPGMQIAVGGCLAQKDRATITEKAPWVDVVFGTHNIGSLPALLDRARANDEAQVEILESLDVFPSTLPTRRESAYAAWVSVSVGCNNTCTFCIVPALRGKEKDRRPGEILAEIEALVAEGVSEITLLGQNVNAYGVEFGDRQAFSKLLRSCGGIDGLERVRFTSPHPAEFTDDVIEAMAETPNVMPSLHMPLQSGSDHVLKVDAPQLPPGALPRDHRAGPGRDAGGRDHDRHHRRLPGRDRGRLPGDAGRGARGEVRGRVHVPVLQAPRHPGRGPAGPDRRPRWSRTATSGWSRSPTTSRGPRTRAVVGQAVELMVAEGEGRKDAATARLSGRARDNRLVHFATTRTDIRPGDVVTTAVTYAAPHHLVADGEPVDVRRTRSGDAWEARRTAAPPTPVHVTLGMPSVGRPAEQPVDLSPNLVCGPPGPA